MTYKQALLYLDSFINYEKKSSLNQRIFKLNRIKTFLDILGNPHKDLKFIHIAGTKGKGSTSLFIANILREAGFKAGLYTSPHLTSFRERIRILNPKIQSNSDFEGVIPEEKVSQLLSYLRSSIDRFNKDYNFGNLSFFEVYTSLAFLYFKKQNVDWVVLETGLGGRLDATNMVEEKIACITPISFEHTKVLGNTLIKIAEEKLGIIHKKNTTLITAPQAREVEKLIHKNVKKLSLNLIELKINQITPKTASLVSQRFDFSGQKHNYNNLSIKLLGRHQLINAGLAVLAAEYLGINKKAINLGLKNSFWPARFEILKTNPFIIIDGAQNAASFDILNTTVKDNFKDFKKILILGLSNDKDIKRISKMLSLYDEIILTQSRNPRAMPINTMKRFIKQKTFSTTNIKDALKLANSLSNKKSIILISGSLFLAAEARQIFKKQQCLTG